MIEISEKEFQQLSTFVKISYGLDLHQKKTLVESRLQGILAEKEFHAFSLYYEYLMSDKTGEALQVLMNKLTTNHTFFLREADHFNYFRDRVLPYLKAVVKDRDLRIWSAGCSSGEEPYTLAMIMADFFGLEKSSWETKLLATDISQRVLDAAIEGVYTDEQIASIPEGWRKKYFKRIDKTVFQVVDGIRNDVIFRVFNLNNGVFPFRKKFHVIFCRNVMIYFDIPTKRELIDRFYDLTEPGGYLFIGHSESICEGTKYKYKAPAIYRKE